MVKNNKYYYDLFIRIMNDFQENYSYLFIKKYTIPQIIKIFENDFKNYCFNDENFLYYLRKALSLFEDYHIGFLDKKTNKYYQANLNNKPLISNFDNDLIYKKYLKNNLLFSNNIGALAKYNDILYVNFFTWNREYKKEILKLINTFFKNIKENNFKKIIIDLRSNTGGDDRLSRKVLIPFIPKKTQILVTKYKFRLDKNNPEKIGREFDVFEINSNDFFIDANVSVLIGNYCMSSNEYLICGFNYLREHNDKFKDKINLIGDKTVGSFGRPIEFNYDDWLVVRIPSWIAYDFRGYLFEGKGVEPNIKINPSKSIFFRKDKVFEKAVDILNKFDN